MRVWNTGDLFWRTRMRLGMHLGSFSCSQGIRKPFCSARALQPAKLSQRSVSKQQRVPALHAVATRVAGKSKSSKRVQQEEEEGEHSLSTSSSHEKDLNACDLEMCDNPDTCISTPLAPLFHEQTVYSRLRCCTVYRELYQLQILVAVKDDA